MKSNLLLKVWGIVLTVAILSGLLMVSVPVAAADSAYSFVTTPKSMTANTNINQFVAAADGQTMFVYSNNNTVPGTIAAVGGVVAATTVYYGMTNTVTALGAGAMTLTLPAGVTAAVTAGTAGATYAAPTITVTGAGTFTIILTSGNKFYKSANAGKTWAGTSSPGTVNNGLDNAVVVALAISPNFATDNTLLVGTDVDTVLISTNGGTTFVNAFGFPALGATENIASLAVYGMNMVVGTTTAPAYTGTVYLFSPVTYTWTNQVASGTLAAGNVIGVAFSPMYAADAQVFAVVSESATATTVNNRIVATGSTWGGSYLKASYPAAITAIPPTLPPTKASIAFGSDYAVYTGSFLVALNGSDVDDCYRYTAVANAIGATNRLVDLNIGGAGTHTSVWSLSIKGGMSDAVYAGLTAGSVRKATGAAVVATWTAPTVKALTGTNPIVVATNDAIYAGTIGGAFLSAFQVSTDDLVTFNKLSMISVSSTNMTATDLAVVDANTMFLVMTNAGLGDLVFKTTDAGANWSCINSNATGTFLGVYPSPAYATDNTLYIPVTTISVLKSVNGGSTFTVQAVGNPGGAISAFAPLDGTTYYVGFTGGQVYKSNRFITSAATDAAGVYSITLGAANEVFVGTMNGRVFRSTDDAVTFSTSTVGSLAAAAGQNVTVTLDPAYATNKTIYMTNDAALGVSSFVIGTSAAWFTFTGAISPDAAVVASNGILYTGDSVASATPLYRSLNPKATSVAAAGVNSIDGTYASATLAMPATPTVTVKAVISAATGNTVIAIGGGWAVSATSAYPYAFRVLTLTDKFITAPAGLAPTGNNISINNTRLSWTAVTFATASPLPTTRYEYRINTDSALLATSAAVSTGTSAYANVATVAGQTYYYQVRATTNVITAPVNTIGFYTPWSATSSFSTKLYEPAAGTGPNAVGVVAPAAGSTLTIATGQTSLSPTFNWSAVAGATSYEIKISSKADFSDVIDSSVGLTTTVYTTPVKMAPGVYYWEIRAVAGTNIGDWLQSAFTVAAPAAAAPVATAPAQTIVVPTPVVNVPPATVNVTVPTSAPAPASTPAWAWVVIAIGAVLVIAVIVLIARTRRV